MSYVLAFLGFALLIILHEGGHFAAAKAVGMRVERFSLFFGPMFVKKQVGETEYGIGVIPLGGYVKITGMSPNEVFEDASVEARAYINQPVWKRIVVIAAGPAVNMVLAIVLAFVFFIGVGRHNVLTSNGQPASTSTIGAVYTHSAAAGVLKPGDVLVSVDGVKGGPGKLHDEILKHTCAAGAHVDGCLATTAATIVVRRGGALRTFHLRPRWSGTYREMLIGFGFDYKYAPNGVAYSAGQSVTALWSVTTRTVSALAQLFKAQERKQLHGIVGIYAATQQGIASSWTNGVEILAVISWALGMFNLFPFLPLDGGHIFWALVEKARGRRVPLVVIERASYVGLAILAIIVCVGLSNDIHGLAGKGLGA